MSNILLFTCLLALCLPILSVHLSRSKRIRTLSHLRSTSITEPRSERRARPLRRHAHSHLPSHAYSYARPQTDGTASEASEDGTDQTPQPQPRVRKPWDPPFPRESIVGVGRGSGSWLVPAVSPSRADTQTNDAIAKNSAQDTINTKPSNLSILSLISRLLAVLLFILAFAILIAHCLAWFLVYKTEARLGEARRGMIRGGDMRLCLCAK